MAGMKALVKPALLVWARDRAKVKTEDAAKAANVTTQRIEAWENGDQAPTLSQLRLLASKYRFPLAVFFLPEPPTDFEPLRDFRRLPDHDDQALSPDLAYQIRKAQERRELALELYDDQRNAPQPFPLKATLQDDPEAIGQKVREFLNVDPESQKKAARAQRAFEYWRRRLEERDVLVFVLSGPHYAVELREMRGFAIARLVLPVVVVNGKDHSQGGRAFTLLHELAHLILGESAISNGATEELEESPEDQRVERFCDAVAAAALMPAVLVLSFPQAAPAGMRAWANMDLQTIAGAIGVSSHALLLRFVTLKRASWDFYRHWRARYDQPMAEKAAPAGAVMIPRPILLMSANGRGYTRMVLRSYYDQRITLSDVSSYLGAKVKYIPALERAAFQVAE